jgi:CelD/BcsL family acetyltransferase involved in cellulose biosynthesis
VPNSELVTELSQLTPLACEWDELAVANELPLMAPACVLAWWRNLAPAHARPRVIVVREGSRLIGLAPFYVLPGVRGAGLGLRLPGVELGGRLAPLAAAGDEPAVARSLALELAGEGSRARSVTLEGAPLGCDWAAAIGDRWPGRWRPAQRRYQVAGCPTVSLREDSFDAWLSAKSSNFRREMRRLRRQFAAAGGTARSSTAETLRSDVEVFVRLHAARWEGRGSSSFVGLGERLGGVLEDIGRALLEQEGRFRMRVLELDGDPISAQLFLAAGGRVLYVNGGWDERHAKLKPSMLGILDVIEEAFERGESKVDLGLGEQQYKMRFADGSDPVVWTILVPAGVRLPLTLGRTAPVRGRAALRRLLRARLSEQQLARLLRLREAVHRRAAG